MNLNNVESASEIEVADLIADFSQAVYLCNNIININPDMKGRFSYNDNVTLDMDNKFKVGSHGISSCVLRNYTVNLYAPLTKLINFFL